MGIAAFISLIIVEGTIILAGNGEMIGLGFNSRSHPSNIGHAALRSKGGFW